MEKLDVVNAALAALRAGETCELVVVAGTAGSSPRGVGAWMAVFADGSQAGTIGGGWLLTPQAPPQDLDGSCSVDGADLAALLAQWGPATSATTAHVVEVIPITTAPKASSAVHSHSSATAIYTPP